MNLVALMGRLTADPEYKTTPNGKRVCTFTVAARRKAKDKEGNAACMLSYYTDDDEAGEVTLQINLQGMGHKYEVYLLDEDNTNEFIMEVGPSFELTLKRNSVVLLKSK